MVEVLTHHYRSTTSQEGGWYDAVIFSSKFITSTLNTVSSVKDLYIIQDTIGLLDIIITNC